MEGCERAFHTTVWLGCIFYAVWSAVHASHVYSGTGVLDGDLGHGWLGAGRNVDISDAEWNVALKLFRALLPWYIIHHLVSQLLRTRLHLELWHGFLGCSFVVLHMGFGPLLLLLIQPVLLHAVAKTESARLLWITAVISLLLLNYYNDSVLELFNLDFDSHHMLVITVSWINLRCLNYLLDVLNEQPIILNLGRLISYCFYLPVMLHGPIILYSDYQTVLSIKTRKPFFERLTRVSLKLVRFCWWMLFTHFALHFVYVSALTFQLGLLWQMDAWALYGLGYCMGQFFHLKYVVIYGISTSLAELDGIPVPHIPKCIGRIHLYSDMWRHFDRALYVFLVRYIYRPVIIKRPFITVQQKLFGSFLCFCFVCLWHGLYDYVIIWTFLNFIEIIAESFFLSFYRKKTNLWNPQIARRLECILTSPLFAISALSNFYFFAGKDTGNLFVYRFMNGSWFTIVSLLLILYCGSHVSCRISEWEQMKSTCTIKKNTFYSKLIKTNNFINYVHD